MITSQLEVITSYYVKNASLYITISLYMTDTTIKKKSLSTAEKSYIFKKKRNVEEMTLFTIWKVENVMIIRNWPEKCENTKTERILNVIKLK